MGRCTWRRPSTEAVKAKEGHANAYLSLVRWRGVSMPSHIACAVQSCAASGPDDAVDPFQDCASNGRYCYIITIAE